MTAATIDTATTGKKSRVKKNSSSWKSFFTVPVIVSSVVLVLILLSAVFANVIAPYDPNQVSLGAILSPPSGSHLLGTDKTGRDIFSRVLFGSRTTMLSAIGVVAISMVIGIPYGLASGYFGGWLDKILMRISDVILSFPSLLLAFLLIAAFGRSLTNAVVAVGIVYVPMLARLTRSVALVEKNKTYVEAAQSIGYSSAHIMFREILPNCVPALIVQGTLDLGYAILDLAAMSFLGLGVQPPTSDWGAMLEEGRGLIQLAPLCALAPGAMILITVVAINVLGDGINHWLDPKQRKLMPMRRFRKLVLGGER
ncbi:amino acid ABC transporter permease [Bifidobacterium goeldii]|uniref:Amino acid ABC transporter permease n=1 Tax=Bifidobacterium goeldii TaxID=2306975 RepID=A0A430FJB3_9BIFI|nr:ABC transporter permease [Bifidobacterium goeldii]RSX52818.1 amino acid ABC transporter permease [Bifidobacterium goeldii]